MRAFTKDEREGLERSPLVQLALAVYRARIRRLFLRVAGLAFSTVLLAVFYGERDLGAGLLALVAVLLMARATAVGIVDAGR